MTAPAAKYHLFIVDALWRDEHLSAIDHIRKLRYRPTVRQALGQYEERPAATPDLFAAALGAFCLWQDALPCLPSCNVILLLCLHGEPEPPPEDLEGHKRWLEGANVVFADGTVMSRLDLLAPIRAKLRSDTILAMRNCWGAFPGISRGVSIPNRSPKLALGATLPVKEGAQKHADKAMLDFLASHVSFTDQDVHGFIDGVNAWAVGRYPDHDSFYRAWWWNAVGEFVRWPGNVKGCKVVRRIT